MQNVIRPLNDEHSMIAVVQHIGDDKMVVNAARVSFGGDNQLPLDTRDEKLIKYLLKHQHGSPLEHNLITFKVVAPVFVDRQWVRHRVGVSKNEISGRYVELKDNNYKPNQFRAQAKSNRQASVEDSGQTLDQVKANYVYEKAWKNSWQAYQDLLFLGVAREQARGVLPLSLYTENYYTFNLRSLLHFVGLRDHEGAQWEIQQYAKAMLELTRPLFPVTIAAYEELHAA